MSGSWGARSEEDTVCLDEAAMIKNVQ